MKDDILQKNLKLVEEYLNKNRRMINWSETQNIQSFERKNEDPFLKEIMEIQKILKDIEKMFQS